MIPVAAKNAAFLTMAIELGHDAAIYEERFGRALNKALEAAAPHMLGDAREAAEGIRDWKEDGPEEAWAVLEANHARLSRYGPTP